MPVNRLAPGGSIAIAVATLLCALLGIELGLRLWRPVRFMRPEPPRSDAGPDWHGVIHRTSSLPGLAYELAPDLDLESLHVRITTNSLGMRDREPLPASTPGLTRILDVGDSMTFGYRVEQRESFGSVLEELLAQSPLAAGRVFDVLNTGVSGYSTHDELVAFEGKWLELEPKLVLLEYCLNDPEIVPMQPLKRLFIAPKPWQHSHVLRLLAQKWQSRRVRTLGGGNYFRYLHAPGEPPWRGVQDAFARFGELAQERRFALVLVIFPMFSPAAWKDYPYREVHARVAREAQHNGFAVLDLLPRFEREDPASLLIEALDAHPNARGHRIAGEEILRFLEVHPELLAAGH